MSLDVSQVSAPVREYYYHETEFGTERLNPSAPDDHRPDQSPKGDIGGVRMKDVEPAVKESVS